MSKEDALKKIFEDQMKKENNTEIQEEIKNAISAETLKKELAKEIKIQSKDSKDLKIEELINDLKRLQADFQNHCKRVEQEKKDFIEYAAGGVLCKLLLIVDEMEIALKSMKHPEDQKGILMILNKIKKLLLEEGVTQMACKGQKFDPFRHEAILYENGKDDGVILDEIQKGYQMKGKILRYPKVKVSRNESNSDEAAPQMEGE